MSTGRTCLNDLGQEWRPATTDRRDAAASFTRKRDRIMARELENARYGRA
ncbi:hypothetical protein [Bosea sp. Root381]|nr:hypothetical protein [Bosea sp. Root381]